MRGSREREKEEEWRMERKGQRPVGRSDVKVRRLGRDPVRTRLGRGSGKLRLWFSDGKRKGDSDVRGRREKRERKEGAARGSSVVQLAGRAAVVEARRWSRGARGAPLLGAGRARKAGTLGVRSWLQAREGGGCGLLVIWVARKSRELVGGCRWKGVDLRWMVVGSVGKTRRRPGGLAAAGRI